MKPSLFTHIENTTKIQQTYSARPTKRDVARLQQKNENTNQTSIKLEKRHITIWQRAISSANTGDSGEFHLLI
jgi:hypothetical protein